MKRSGAIGNEVAVTRRHIGEYDANRRLDIRGIRKITKDLILVNNEVSTKFGGVAQLGEHLPCKQGVRSSILLISTSVCETNASIHVMLTTSRRLFRQGTAFYGSKKCSC